MKNSKSYIVLLCLLAKCMIGSGSDWVTVQIDSSASIGFPAQPALTEDSDDERTLTYTDSTVVYSVSRMENLGGINNRKLVYDEYIRGLTETSASRQIRIQDFELSGIIGKDVSCKLVQPEGITFVRARVLLFNDTLYSYAAASHDSADILTKSAIPFLESFRINRHEPVSKPYRPLWRHIPAAYAKVFGVLMWVVILLAAFFAAYFIYNKLKSGKQQ